MLYAWEVRTDSEETDCVLDLPEYGTHVYKPDIYKLLLLHPLTSTYNTEDIYPFLSMPLQSPKT